MKKNKQSKPITSTEQKPDIKFLDKDAIIFTSIALAMFILLRILFPVPDYIPDSRGYLLGAMTNAEIGYRPMGISFFIRKVHAISPDLTFIATVQFLLHCLSSLAFVHICLKFFNLTRVYKNALYCFTLLNPVMLHMCNMIISDSLFTSLTIAWITLLLHILYKPNWLALAGIVLVFWMSFHIRYNALVYPVITVAALLLTRNMKILLIGLTTCIILITSFYITTSDKMEDATNVRVFSGFSGWQLASNAITAYKHNNNNEDLKTDNPVLANLHKWSHEYIDSIKKTTPSYADRLDPDFMWGKSSPFIRLQDSVRRQLRCGEFESWTETSLILQDYGKALIGQHPLDYVQYFLLPNAKMYLHPPLEFLSAYNATGIYMLPNLQEWYDTPAEVKNDNESLPRYYNTPMLWLYTILNILFVICIPMLWINRAKWPIGANGWKAIILFSIILICKFGFDVLAAPVSFRYVAMMMPIMFCIIIVCLSQYMAMKAANK